MMLDSSIGKILSTTKPVEPSIPGKSEEPETKNDSATATRSEAEVRIVFRLSVEEQIVYNGKIEQVKQLESEELSRIVSRIAWDGANDSKKPMFDRNPIKNDEITDSQKDQTKQEHQNNSNDTSQSLNVLKDVDVKETFKEISKAAYDMDCSPTNGHDPNLEFNMPANADNIIYIDSDSPTDIVKSTLQDETRIDAITPPNSYHICESDTRPNSSYDVKEDESQPNTHEEQQGVEIQANNLAITLIDSHNAEIDDAAAAAAESQMIVETLYDCVSKVDMESRKSDSTLTVNNEFDGSQELKPDEQNETIETTQIQHNELAPDTCKEVIKLDKKPLMEAVNVPPNQDTPTPNPEDSYLKNKGTRSHQTCKDDLSLKTELTRRSDLILTSRRRNTCDVAATTNRRIRRSGSKDSKTPRISSNGGKGENNEQTNVTADIANSRRHFAQQSKVFAKWSDNHFYPGTILDSTKDGKLKIAYCDGASKWLVETDLIPMSNILCKQVRVSISKPYCVNAIVHEQLVNNGQPMFDVSYQQNGLVKKCVPLRDIFLTPDQGASLINQPMRPDKNPDESMFAGVDLDNIVHNKRSRRLLETDDLEISEESLGQASNTSLLAGRRKKGQYNSRTPTNRARSGVKVEGQTERGLKRSHSDVNNQDTPISSCSPDNTKAHLHSSNSNPPSESSNSVGSTNSAANGHDIGQEFFFGSTSPHRTKTSLLHS